MKNNGKEIPPIMKRHRKTSLNYPTIIAFININCGYDWINKIMKNVNKGSFCDVKLQFRNRGIELWLLYKPRI